MLNDKNSKDDHDHSQFHTPDGQNQESILNYGEKLSQEKDSYSKIESNRIERLNQKNASQDLNQGSKINRKQVPIKGLPFDDKQKKSYQNGDGSFIPDSRTYDEDIIGNSFKMQSLEGNLNENFVNMEKNKRQKIGLKYGKSVVSVENERARNFTTIVPGSQNNQIEQMNKNLIGSHQTIESSRFEKEYANKVIGLLKNSSGVNQNGNDQKLFERKANFDNGIYEKLGGQNGNRNNSMFGNIKTNANLISSGEQSQFTGLTLTNQSPLIEELKKNNFEKVSKLMNQFIVGNENSGTITGRISQQKNRSIKNTFQTMAAQRQKSGVERESTKFTDNIEYPGAVGPKKQINVPKQLVLYQLSKNVDAQLIEQSFSQSGIGKSGLYNQASQLKNDQRIQNSFLDFLEGSLAGFDVKGQSKNDQGLAGQQTQSHSIQINQKSPFASKSFRTIEQINQKDFPRDPTNQALNNPSYLQFDQSQLSAILSSNDMPSLPIFAKLGASTTTPALTNFHITDLLEKSIIVGAKEREQYKLQQIVEFYKRQVKDDKEIKSKREILIRNYRLHLVKNSDKEIDPKSRSLFTLNKGTSIYVSNSIVKPEIHKFKTQISDKLEQVYPYLQQDPQDLFENEIMKTKRHQRGVSQRVQNKTPHTERNLLEKNTMQIDEQNIYQHDPYLEEERSQSAAQTSRIGKTAGSRIVDKLGPDLQSNDQDMLETQSRPFSAVDLAEQDAILKTNKIFDRWLRNIISQQSVKMQVPKRQVLTNGLVAAPTQFDINWQIAMKVGSLQKEKPLPLERLTSQSFYDDTPYRQLQMLVVNQDIRNWYSKFVLKTQSVRSYSQIVHSDLQSMSFSDSKVAIDFSRHHLTHLDPVVFKDENLPLELFLDYDIWIRSLAKTVRDLKSDNELLRQRDWRGIDATTFYYQIDGSKELIQVKIIDFDPFKGRFLVMNKEMDITTWRSRLFVTLTTDKIDDVEAHRAEVISRKADTLQFLRLHRLINAEMTKRYNYLRLSNQTLQQIQNKLAINILQFNPDSVRKIILQIEALYVFSILKSVLSSQRNDPFIKNLLQSYKIGMDSCSLKTYKVQHQEKSDLKGIEKFNMNGIKIELDKNSLLLMNEKYIQLPIFLNSITFNTIGQHKLFRFPYDVNLLIAQNGKEFKKIKIENLSAMINQFPLQHDMFVNAQNIMSKYFHQVAKFRWAESIKNEIQTFVKDDFDFDVSKRITEDQIDPVLLRLFYQLKLFMQTVIFSHFEQALKDYLKFLLGFSIRDQELKNSKIIEEIKYNNLIKLNDSQKYNIEQGQITNDIDLIPLQRKPMILISTQIDDFSLPNKNQKKQKIVTKPELEAVHKDLFSIILNMHASLQSIERVDQLIFPLLQLEDPYLLVPDVKNNQMLSDYVRVIEKLIDQCLKPTKRELVNITTFMSIFDKRTDNIISDLKKRSFELQQDPSDGEGEGGAQNKKGSESEGKTKNVKKEEGQESEEDDESYGDDNEEAGKGDDGYQGNDMAYKSVEIDDGLMRSEIFQLRDLVWKVLENINNQYDFGLIYLDCLKFKDRILSHIKDLIDHLESYIRSDFTNKQKAIWTEIVSVRGKLDMQVESIDDVIMLLDYIEGLKKQDNQIADISLMILDLVKRMEYIETVKIRFPDAQYSEFLNIRNWPKTFKLYIDDRKKELLDQKEDLYKEMSKEIEDVFEKIKGFKETIQEVLSKGLVDKELSYDDEEKASVGDSDGAGSDKKAPSLNQEEEEAKKLEMQKMLDSADGKTFSWIAKEIKMDHMKFDQDEIERIFFKIEFLKQNYDEVEKSCALINKREALLSVPKTQFSELAVIQDDLKPLYALWLVASKFCRTLPQWVEGRFESLDAGMIEQKIDEWINELKRLQKTQMVVDNFKQQELQKFMFDSLNRFKRYGPMLRTLRTKGLAARHWRMIGAKLDVQIDPQSITLYRLIKLELDDEDKLKTIKQICEMATKEYAVQMALETLDKEMRAVEFEFQIQFDSETVVIIKLPDVILMFEEFFLRASVLKTNPHIRNFLDKLIEIEKIIKNVVELVNEWAIFQRNFVYLNSIFCLDEIAKSLPGESKIFSQVQLLYGVTTSSFQTTPQVYRINFRENFLSVLMKCNGDCEHIRGGLMEFLERKRGKFPRLFFLSNEELIDIFGKGNQLVEFLMEDESKSFISSIFEGVELVKFHQITQEITHMKSKDGEEVKLIKEVITRGGTVDSWLKNFEINMINTVKDSLFLTFEQMEIQDVETWVQSWAGQSTFLCSQIWFTMKIISIYLGNSERERAMRFTGGTGNNEKDNENDEDDEDKPQNSNKNQDETIDPDEADERAYKEQLARDVKKEEDVAPEKAQLEKILHLRERFRINKSKPPGEQMEKVQKEIAHKILLFTSMVRKKLKNNVRAATVALLTGYVHFRDILNGLMRDKVYRAEEFKWQMQFKFEMKNMQEVVKKSAYDTGSVRKLDTKELKVDCEVFGNIRPYGFEYLGNCPRLVVTPLTERCQRSLLVALQYHFGGAPEGPFGTGKTETTKDLGRQMAKLTFVLNSSANFEYAGVARFFKGLASSGAWVCFDEFNRMDSNILSLMSQVIITIQNAIKTQASHLNLDDQKIKLEQDCAIFITLNPGYAGRTELPINLKALFRPISMVVPDSVFITEILLYSSGFVGAQQLAKKIVQVQSLANVVMKKTDIAHDFGLRSIKAIVSIAETLKLNAQNISKSDLLEIIDDESLSQVPYKADQIIKEVMAGSQARIARATETSKLGGRGGDGKIQAGKGIIGKKKEHGEEMVRIQEAGDYEENENESNQSPALGGSKKDIGKRQGLASIAEHVQGKEKDGGGFRESIQSQKEVQQSKEGNGELYNRLWGNITPVERQKRIVYRQIGIDPEQHYSEEELEEYIILKAVRDFNHSKFATEEHLLIEGAIKDVFQGAVPDLDKPVQDYGNLKEAILQSFEYMKIDFSQALKTKALQFFEIQRSKHGCILVGEPQSGKTTLIQLLSTALNRAAMNEYALQVAEKRRERLLQLAEEYEKELVETNLQNTQKSGKSGLASNEMIGGAVKKKNKNKDKDSQAKKQLEKWQMMYRDTKLSDEEHQQIKANLHVKGVSMRRVNPKGVTIDELFGTFDKESHEWQEGIFTQHYREFSDQKNDKKKWILLDGPIDFMWVENLNSILDDNKKMSLPNGESIKMSEGMCILLEASNMKNVTPATVSRCGLVALHKKECCSPKGIFNQFLRNLPPNISEFAKDLEVAANFLMVEAINIFNEEKENGTLNYQQADQHWLMQSFVRLLTTLIFDFYIEYERGNQGQNLNPNEFGKSIQNMTLGNRWVDLVQDPNETIFKDSEMNDQNEQVAASRQGSRLTAQRVATPDQRQRELEKKKRLPRCNFIDSELRYENALKFTPIWLEAFVVFSIVWTFQPVLSEKGRKKLDFNLQEKYATARTEYSVYQKEKKRKMADKNREKSQSNKQSIDKQKSSRVSAAMSKKSASEKSQHLSTEGASQAQQQKEKDAQANTDGFTPVWTDELDEKPMLISDYPENISFYDCYFNVESSAWSKYALDVETSDAQIAYGELVPSQKSMQNFFVPTHSSVRYSMLLECCVTNQVSSLIIGKAGSGKSAFLRQTLFTQVFTYTKQLITDHVTMTCHTDSIIFKENVERLLEWRLNKSTNTRKLRPHLDNKLVCYVEDLHLTMTDTHGDQPAVESLRDYLTQQAWLSSRKRKWREIEDVSFFACMASNAPETPNVSGRILHKFNLIVLDEANADSVKYLYKSLSDFIVQSWPSAIQIYQQNLLDAVIDISMKVFSHLKPTPMKAHYTFSWKDVLKIMSSIQMIESNSLRRQSNVMKLFYHECLRTYGDRLMMAHDSQWFLSTLKEVCQKHFWVVEQLENFSELKQEKNSKMNADEETDHQKRKVKEEIDPKRKDQFLWPIADPDQLYFSILNQEVEGFYMEVEKIDDIQRVIQGVLDRYNDSNERVRIDFMLFNQLNRLILKILRVITLPNGHLINVAMKGYGMKSVMKLAAFSANHQLRELEVYEGVQPEDWQGDLRRAVIFCGNEDRPLTFYVDEYKMIRDSMYWDLECLLKNNVVTEITRKGDILLALANIYQQVEAEKKALKFGLSNEESKADQLTQEQMKERNKEQDEQQTEFISDNKRMMQKWPHIQAELYKIFLNRVKKNFHLVLQYSPTGTNFREKITKNKEIMYLSQMIFLQDLPAPELESLGKSFFKLEKEKAENKAIIDGTGIPKIGQYSVNKDPDSQDKVLRCIVKLYLQAQESTKKYAEDQSQLLYLTPTQFLRVFDCYKKLLKERKVIVKDISARYDAGLDKIRQTQDAIYRYHQELERRSPILQEKQRSLMRVIHDIEEEFTRVKGQRDQLKRDEFEAEGQTEQAKKIRDQCDDTLQKILPSLKEALESVSSLKKHEIAELKSMKKPPKVVKLVLQAVCMLLGVEPAWKKSKKTGRPKLSYWKAAQGPEVLGNPRLEQSLVAFDRNKVTPETMMEVEEVLTSNNYSHENARSASIAATGLFKWVQSTREYFYIFKEIEPSRDAFILAEKQFEQKKKQLLEKTEKIGHLETALKGLKEHQKSKDDIIEELRAEIEDCSVRKKRADTLLKGLSSEKQKWIVCTRMLSSKYNTVTGDVLLSAGYITLLGGFDQRFRNKVIQKWQKILIDEGFQCSREFIFTELFGDSYKIRKWHQNKLPADTMSVNNALIVEKTKQFCLLLDPQLQGLTWLKNQFDDAGTLTTMKQNDIQFKKQIEIAVDMGRSVIVEQIGSVIDLNLQSIIRKDVSKYGGARMIQFCRKSYKFDKNFRLFVVSSHPRPNFDVNITNHVTVLNFSVSLESLQSQMLGLVVLNERKDLDDTFNENSKEAFDSIKSLKDIEAAILSQLDMQVQDLLGEESLIRTLAESKNTAEYVASKLKNIAQTNQFIQRSREIYSPVAYRASILFFVVQDFQKINIMYQFSLQWFKMVFVKSLELTNQMRQDQAKGEENEDEGDTAQKIMNNTYSVDERIELLLKTFTQELFKKIQMSVFEEDRNIITQTMVMRVMEHENFIEKSLCDFLLNGPKNISVSTQIPQEINPISGLNNMIWANLIALANIKPFNQTNLLAHFIQNQDKWKRLIEKQEATITWEELPNNDLLDLRFFTLSDIDEMDFSENQRLEGSDQFLRGTDAASMAGKTVGDTNSRLGSRGGQGSSMKRSESEILRDPEIWQISDSDEFEDDENKSAKNKENDDNQSKKGSEFEIKDENEMDKQEMARYLVEQAPSFGGQRNGGNINSLKRKTQSERNLILKREKAIKSLVELCIVRCLRADLLIAGMERFAQNLVDPNYFDFKDDILAPYLLKLNKAQGGKGLSIHQAAAIDQAKKIVVQSKMSTSKMSGNAASQIGMDPNATAGSKMNNYGSGLNDTKQSGISGQAALKKGAKDEIDKVEKEKREKRGGMNNIRNLIREAYEDSDSKSPIFFLITHSFNIQDIITEFLTKKVSTSSSLKPWFFSMGKGVEEEVEDRLMRAAQNGDWLILENLHLVPDWLPVFEEKLSKFKGQDLNQRFRIWLTSSPVKNFPSSILEKSIKVALQPPKSIKSKIERMLIEQEKEAFFRKSGKNGNIHKNVFFGLIYFHAILEGRIKYGVLGWNVPYKFDSSDFEVSNAQLTQIMRSAQTDQSAALEMLRYFFANINYAGKIQRVDDQITLNAIVGDLFSDQIIFSEEAVPADVAKSHYGFPLDNSDYFSYCDKIIPPQDSFEIFGFNYNIECNLKQKQAYSILDQMISFSQKQSQISSDDQKENIQLSSVKTSLRSSSQSSGNQIFQMIKSETSLLSLFIALQKLLSSSSLDKSLSQSTRRYDQNIDQDVLPKRDLNDIKVVEVAKLLLIQLDAQIDLDQIQKKFPIRYKAPLHNVINRELTSYKILLKAIRESVADLLANIDGKYPRPLEIEDLWSKIQENKVPKKWRAVSFQTAYDSLADFIIELGLKLEFWRKVIDTDIKSIPSYWLPAFFDPKSFLAALIQTRARIDEIPMRDLRNEYEVIDNYTNSVVHPDKNVKYLHGLYLEGADWDPARKLIVQSTDLRRFVPFPAIRVRTTRSGESSGLAATPQENFANFNANQAKKNKAKKSDQLENNSFKVAEQEQKKKYKCPLYKTTLRLSTGLVSQDNVPVEYLKLETMEEPSKWTKRAVALLLETDRTDTS